MAKINGYTRKFCGRLAGDTIGELVKKLDYSLDSLQDRIELVDNICKSDFFIEYFDVKDKTMIDHNIEVAGVIDKSGIEDMKKDTPDRIYYNVHPKCYSESYAGDPLSEDNNVCQALEKMADYILKLDEEYKPQSERQKKKINYLENSLEQSMEYGEDFYDYNAELYKGNYKLEVKQKIFKDDFVETKVDKKRKDKEFIDKRKQHLAQMQEAIVGLENIKNSSNSKKYFIDKAIGELRHDMLMLKDSYNGTIYFKRVMPDSCDMDENQIDFRDINHIKALLECSPSSQKWYGTTSTSLEQYLHDVRYKIAKEDWDNLMFMRECSNISSTKFYDETGVNLPEINASIMRIAKIIYKHHMTISWNLFYLNIAKGRYKKCSRCNEVKLTMDFNKHPQSLDGYRPECKDCRKNEDK